MRKKKALIPMLAMLLVFTGCMGESDVNKDVELQDEETSVLSYNTVLCDRGDVECILDLSLVYDVTRTEEYSFGVDGEKVENLYVEKGDLVSEGELLAVLGSENIESRIKETEYKIRKKQLQISQTLENKQFEIDRENDLYTYTSKEGKDRTDHREKLESIDNKYASSLRTLQDDLTILQMQLEETKEYFEASHIYAGMNGIVYYIKTALKGSTTTADEAVIKIYDPDSSKFICDDVSAGEYFNDSDTYTLVCGYGSKQQLIDVKTTDREAWVDEIYFAPQGEYPDLEISDTGHIYISTDMKKNVLRIPVECLHLSEDRYYVYIIDKDNVRRMRFIEPGLIGDEYIEVISGLTEGEPVVK
ncbi:MAG: efflux RND transporter periplasmic adaptor subunit [Lachnospiraceae bacterium]|nr:efflux RND transporter periplasmic adaptor subunit [Lachnospiraceae bacterium]